MLEQPVFSRGHEMADEFRCSVSFPVEKDSMAETEANGFIFIQFLT